MRLISSYRCRRAKRSYSKFKVKRGGRVAIAPSKVRSSGWLCWSSREEISHIQGKRNLSKMVGVARGHQRVDALITITEN